MKLNLKYFIYLMILICGTKMFSRGKCCRPKEKQCKSVCRGAYSSGVYSLYEPYYSGYSDPFYHMGAPYGKVSTSVIPTGFGTYW